MILFFVTATLLLASCEKDTTNLVKTIDLKSFRLQTPIGWKNISGTGYDSQVGHLTNGRDLLTYDYGSYSYDLRDEKSATHIRINTTIDGHPALVVRPKQKGKGVTGVYITAQSKLVISGKDIQDEETALKIFESIKF